MAQQQVEIELSRLKDQVNSLFLNALLADLGNRLEKIKASVRFGEKRFKRRTKPQSRAWKNQEN